VAGSFPTTQLCLATFVIGACNTSNHTYENPIWSDSHYPDVKPSQFPVILDTRMSYVVLPTWLP
jgi:hypothetical protein